MYDQINIPSGQEQNTEIDFSLIEKYRVRFSDKVPMPEIVLSICDVNGANKRMIWTRQNISCITAKAKVGKSFLIKLISSAILKKGFFQNRLHSELPEGRDNILYIDTEQAKYHVLLGLSQIKKMLNIKENEIESLENRMKVYQFDAVKTHERIEYVKHLIYKLKPDVVLLDGIADLFYNTNDIVEADERITDLRIWATHNDCHICCVIHQNPSDFADKMKGHAGTKLNDKSEIVIGVSIDKENENNRIVQSLVSRNRKPEPFEFTISENGMPVISEYETTSAKIQGKKALKTDKPDYVLFGILTSVYSKKTSDKVNFYRYGELCSQIGLEYEKSLKETIGNSACKSLLAKFIDKNWILKSGEVGHAEYYLGKFSEKIDEKNNDSDILF